MKRTVLLTIAILAVTFRQEAPCRAGEDRRSVDFSYSPPEWQTAICLPDDPCKTLVDRSGELLYHYGSGREFGTRIGVEVVPGSVWRKQELYSPRVPIVRTWLAMEELEIVEEAFAIPDVRQTAAPAAVPVLQRTDSGNVNRDWAKPPEGTDPSLRHIAVHMGGSIHYEAAVPKGASRRVALALCEGWWNQAGKRVQVLRVEGAEPKTVDTVADLGPNRAGAFWFDGKDANGDGRLEIAVEAASQAADKNTILNGLWVFAADQSPDSDRLLSGKLNSAAVARMSSASRSGPARNDVVLIRVTNRGREVRTLRPRLIVDTMLDFRFEAESQRVVIDDHETVTASLKMTGLAEESRTRRAIQLDEFRVAAGESASFFVRYSGGGTIVMEPAGLEQALESRARAVAFWEAAPLPFGRVQVPDAGIQALLDSSIRNIWQAREIKKGLPAFQVGPTCYRGLWIVDGAKTPLYLEFNQSDAILLQADVVAGLFDILPRRSE